MNGESPAARSEQQLRGFGLAGLAAMLVILAGSLVGPPLSAVLILLWAYAADVPVSDLGLRAPDGGVAALTVAAVLGAALKLGTKAAVMPLLGAPAVNEYYRFVTHNPSALPRMLFAVLVGAGFGEELFFRGYLFERIGAFAGRSRGVLALTVLLTSGLFALAHYQGQGLPGVEQAVVTGLAFGAAYAWTGNLPLVMSAHAAFDLTALALIYWDWEGPVAHLLFR